MRIILLLSASAFLHLSACSPSLSPLYRDYAIAPGDTAVDKRIRSALESAGWDTLQTSVPNTIATDEKVLSHWGIYRVTAALEVTPLGGDHVRVFVHPYRKYIFGGKGKILYLTRRIGTKFMPELNRAFKEQGLNIAGTPFERDDAELR
jgi:hypothetical protein